MKNNAFYAQSGGVTSVINASAAGVIETVRKTKGIDSVLAGQNGIIGALTEELIDTSQWDQSVTESLKCTPAGAFGSCRYKLGSLETHQEQYERLIQVFKAHKIRYFFYNGGGDSADTCLKISKISEEIGYPITAIHIPKTVDNDLPITDCSPGFGSVAKYVAVSLQEAILDVASMCRTSTKVFILEVMGRHAGWIASAGGLAENEDNALPILILFPEIAFNKGAFLAKVDRMIQKFGYCAVVVSEGLKSNNGAFLSDQGTSDAFGHAQLGGVAPVIANIVSTELGVKYHWAVSDYLQRAARHIASQTDLDHAIEVGRAAVALALEGKNAVMPTIERLADEPYSWRVGVANLHEIANVEKKLPRDFITQDGFGITHKAKKYLRPLIIGEAYPNYKGGIPNYLFLNKTLVEKKIKDNFVFS